MLPIVRVDEGIFTTFAAFDTNTPKQQLLIALLSNPLV
jgi:hypothetical protein